MVRADTRFSFCDERKGPNHKQKGKDDVRIQNNKPNKNKQTERMRLTTEQQCMTRMHYEILP